LSLATALCIVAACAVSVAAEPAGRGGGGLLTWRPARPASQHSAQAADPRPSRADQISAVNSDRGHRTARSKRIDPQVKRVVLQLDDDPLANPFNDRMPRSPFRSSGLQTAPTPAVEELPLPEGELESVTTQAQPPNPFEPQPESDAPPPKPDDAGAPPPDDAAAPPAQNGTAPSPFAPIEPDRSQAPDPKRDCETALRILRSNRLNRTTSRAILDLAPQETGELPYECRFGDERRGLNTGREWAQTCYTWKASGLCHKPLYFEQAHMERYGHSWGPLVDSVVSGAHFFASVPMLPYKMGLEPPCECIYPLGHYRPGNCAPHYIEPFPWSIRASAAEAAAVTGLIFAVP
jgi:hypothetical protein